MDAGTQTSLNEAVTFSGLAYEPRRGARLAVQDIRAL